MDVASTAADLIKSGGPAGAGVVPIFFVASKARRAYTGADSDQKPWMRAIEVLSWLTGLAMIVYSVVYFVHRDPSQVVRGSLRGSLKYLDGSQSLWAMGENDPVYIGNHDSRGLTTKTVTWAIIGPKISPGTSIPFLITGRQGGPDLVFDMPCSPTFTTANPSICLSLRRKSL